MKWLRGMESSDCSMACVSATGSTVSIVWDSATGSTVSIVWDSSTGSIGSGVSSIISVTGPALGADALDSRGQAYYTQDDMNIQKKYISLLSNLLECDVYEFATQLRIYVRSCDHIAMCVQCFFFDAVDHVSDSKSSRT